MRPYGQDGRDKMAAIFAYGIFKCILLNENLQ